MAYEIIDNPGPVPPRKNGVKPAHYPFATMAVGKGFDVPRNGKRTPTGCDQVQQHISSAAYFYTKKNPGTKFAVRIWDDNTVRCWREA